MGYIPPSITRLPSLSATTISKWINTTLRCGSMSRTRKCSKCSRSMTKRSCVSEFPPVIFSDMQNLASPIKINGTFTLWSRFSLRCYALCGVIYFGGSLITFHLQNHWCEWTSLGPWQPCGSIKDVKIKGSCFALMRKKCGQWETLRHVVEQSGLFLCL